MNKTIKEDGVIVGAPTNSVGPGQIAGLGVGPQGEPGVSKKNKKKVMPFSAFFRRKVK
jgi:hypothetical protein